MPEREDGVSGLILAGGEGRRMGAPKAFVPFQGEPLLARALGTMRAVAQDVLVACGPLRDARPWLALAEPAGARLVPDMGGGPIAGLRAGAAVAQERRLLVMPVDAPLLSPELLRVLLRAAEGHDAAMPEHGGVLQPLVACYQTQGLARGAAMVRAPRELPRVMDVARVDAAALAGMPHAAHALRDADTPEALAELERLAGGAAR